VGPRWRFDRVDSTQRRAVDYLRDGGEPDGVFVAASQEAGRGRLDHAWASPPGGLYLSAVVREPPQGAPLLPVGVGAYIGAGLIRDFGVPTVLKWPNDLLVLRPPDPPRKVGGVLIDRVARPDGATLAIGVGLNVTSHRSDFPDEVRDHVGILADYAPTPPSIAVAEALVVGAIDRVLALLRTEAGRAELLRACRSALYGRGLRALVDGRPAGIIDALGEDGALWLRSGGEHVRVLAGTVEILEGT